MALIDKAVADLKSHEQDEDFSIQGIAKKHSVEYSTLRRRWTGQTAPRAARYASQQLLSPQQEEGLVEYIRGLTARGLPPTRAMIRNFASNISKQHSAGIDVVRHQADSQQKYELYFKLLHHKIAQYKVEPCNTYNIDKKGFIISITGRSKRVFSRRQWEQKKVREALQDGSRDLMGSSNRSRKARRISWLEQVFNRKTKQKARLSRDWRLLILDGHGSHLSMDFIEYCEAHKILLAVFPPHSTHTLQPLDVGAWESTFTTKLVLKAFEATGMAPMKADVILERFRKQDDNESEARPSTPLPEDWRQMNRLVQNELLHHENSGLRDALTAKKQRKSAGKPLDLQREEEYHGGATFWSPSKFERAQKEERRVARERAKEVRDRMKAEQVAAREARKATQNTRKAPIIAHRGKHKASEAPLAKRKPKRAKGGAAARPSSPEAAPAPPPKQHLSMSDAASSSVRNDDTSLSLCNLRRQTGKPLLHSVVDIYKAHKISNDKSIQFWKDLKCYLPQKPDTRRGFQDRRSSDLIPLELHSPREGFVALSYCWKASIGESKKIKKYRIASEMEKRLKVRDIVLDRTFRFIRYKQACGPMLPLWIDSLSIEQEQTPEKDIAMQSMDLVYKNCTYAVGYLWTRLQTQTEMNRLSDLLGGRIVEGKLVEGYPVFIDGINKEVVREVLDVLTRIMNDIWWTRAWIFQEDYLAGGMMWLIIRHACGLQKPPGHSGLGSLHGEVIVGSDELKRYATLFCLACYESDTMRQDLDIIEQCMEILRKAGKYNILYEYQYAKNDQRSMTIRILKDLDRRGSKYRTDMLPIVANVCGYDVRLATKEQGFKRQSLSLSILALYIANGELLANSHDGDDELRHNVFAFLRENSLRICAPLPDGVLTLIKHCRLSVHRLSPDGIHTKGVLWRLGDIISPQHVPESASATAKSLYQRDLFRNGLNDYQRERLFDLLVVLNKRRRCNKQRYQSITEDLKAYLECTGPSSTHDEWPPQHSMNAMASGIVDAMDTGKYLQLACPVGGSLDSGGGVPYRAILVRDRVDLQSVGSTYVFTSWSRTNKHNEGIMETRKIAKYVSLVVDVDEGVENGISRLKTKRWINGLCFFDGEKKFPFVFEWPCSLSQ
ncbi:hypothetical protein BDW02DRAFT_651685 [Decorospora gaudefroyi]|uniref:DDE-1 domain-containing protein n=1 Tax=Decorospora gaudefroyi TaxID=184978 RepID=A0A6A5K690_9PLEO|nr:hypothetical protein BDW02DRAFT_651685 [Decorospora gaudefroyi]